MSKIVKALLIFTLWQLVLDLGIAGTFFWADGFVYKISMILGFTLLALLIMAKQIRQTAHSFLGILAVPIAYIIHILVGNPFSYVAAVYFAIRKISIIAAGTSNNIFALEGPAVAFAGLWILFSAIGIWQISPKYWKDLKKEWNEFINGPEVSTDSQTEEA